MRSLSPLLLLLAPAFAPAQGVTLAAPQLARGDELVYKGEVVEAGERPGNRFRKFHDLDVRLFVLDSTPGYADCALVTRLCPRADPVIAASAVAIAGADAGRKTPSAAVRIDLVRVDFRGRMALLQPPAGRPPILLNAATPTGPMPGLPLEGPPVAEPGLFVPVPPQAPGVGTTFDVPEGDRPPTAWSVTGETLRNGGRCLELRGVQQTDNYEQPAKAVAGWRRTQRSVVTPADGWASLVERRVERREGNAVVGWVEVKYALQPTTRHTGTRYADVRVEAETAYGYTSELVPLLQRRAAPAEFRVRLLKLDHFVKDQPATGFREAVEATRRRYAAAAEGQAPAVSLLVPEAPAKLAAAPPVGQPAPDFVAPFTRQVGQFRLHDGSGTPAVLVFYQPGATTTPAALAIAEAVADRFAPQVRVVALALSPDAAAVPPFSRLNRADGATARAVYGVATWPRFLIVDGSGRLAWQFAGVGPETGFLLRGQLEALARPTSYGPRVVKPLTLTGGTR